MSMHLQPNTLLESGKYRILETLGQGGFGITYLAEQTNIRKKVCIKEFFPKDYYKRDDNSSSINILSESFKENMLRFKAKFIKEAQTIASLDHANIVPTYDVFEENNTAYYVMDYIEGESLSSIIKQHGALTEEEAVAYIRQIALAREYIHGLNIMHLDVKPGNIMVAANDKRAILIDFGLAKHYDKHSGEATSTTPVGLSHGFAPMEQYKLGGVSKFSPETDVYALGATLYYIVTGSLPPQAADIPEEGISFPTHISSNIRETIKRSMSYLRKDRPHTIKEFLAILNNDEPIITVLSTEDDITKIIVEKVGPKQEDKVAKQESKSHLWLWMVIITTVIVTIVLITLSDNKTIHVDSVDQISHNDIIERQAETSLILLESDTIVSHNELNYEILYTLQSPIEDLHPTAHIDGDIDWIIIDSIDSSKLHYSVKYNPNDNEREGVIIISYNNKSYQYTVTQSGRPQTSRDMWHIVRSGDHLSSIANRYHMNIEELQALNPSIDWGRLQIGSQIKVIGPPATEIWYTTEDEKALIGCNTNAFYTTIQSNDYTENHGVLKFNNDVTTIGREAFENCDNLTNIIIPNSVTAIGEKAFLGCSNLTSINIPYSVTAIVEMAFSGCNKLTSINIPNGVTDIWADSFSCCSSLTSITIPNSVKRIRQGAFSGCSSIKSITIPDSVTEIEDGAFAYCSNLNAVYCKAKTPPTAVFYRFFWYPFDGNADNRKIYVPRESVDAYKKADGWSLYADNIVGYDF